MNVPVNSFKTSLVIPKDFILFMSFVCSFSEGVISFCSCFLWDFISLFPVLDLMSIHSCIPSATHFKYR